MRFWPVLPALALAGAPALAVQSPDPLTWTQMRQMQPEALTRRLFGGLSQMLHPFNPFPDAAGMPGGPAGYLYFLSRPRGAQTGGMCESDLVTVMFEIPPGSSGPEAPLRPRSLRVSTLHFVRDLALTRRSGPPSSGNDPQLDAACAELDPRDFPLMAVPSAPSSVRAVADLLEGARAGHSIAPIDCSAVRRDGSPITENDCLRELAALRAEDIERDQNCGTGPELWDHCLMVVLPPLEIEFDFRGQSGALARVRVFPTRSSRISVFRLGRNFREAPAPPAR